MQTTGTARASGAARRASDSPAARALARAGLTARGVLYILIGWIAILVALGQTSRQADQQGAFQLLAGKPYGLISLWLLAIGFAGYSLWRLSEAAFGVTGDGNGAGPRLKSLARGLIYAGFSFLTFKVISGAQGGSQTKKQQDLTATVMHHAGGRWLIAIVGLIIVICGLVLIFEGIRAKFMKYLQLSRVSRRTRRVVKWLGVTGTAARGAVFALAGVLVIEAAVTYQASKAGGIDKALLTLRDQPFGEFLLFLAAFGLVIFGVYGLCEARWRKV
jgi:succinate dehydrogenase/fumarate reductase cytochrome b subunit